MFEILLHSVVLPLAVVGCLLGVAWRPWSRQDRDKPPEDKPTHCASAIAFATAYVTCHLGLHGSPAGDQLEAWEWLLLLVPVAGLMGVVDAVVRLPSWLLVAAIAGLAAATGWLIVPSFAQSPWGWRLALGCVVIVLYASQRFLSLDSTAQDGVVTTQTEGAKYRSGCLEPSFPRGRSIPPL